MGELLSATTVVHAATLEGLRKELAALQATIAQSTCPRDPEMLREAEAKLVQLTMDINLLEADPRRANLKLRHYPPMVSLAPITHERPAFALAYAWAGVAIMWAFWLSFVIFLAEPRHVLTWWPLPTVDRTASVEPPAVAALIDLALVILFGLQHSVMARARFKQRVMARMPEPLQRVTYVHTANSALFLLILFWQPIPMEIWNIEASPTREVGVGVFGGKPADLATQPAMHGPGAGGESHGMRLRSGSAKRAGCRHGR